MINPATPASVLEEILQDVDQVLVMTVNPGFGAQHFIHTTLPKIRRVRQMIERSSPAATWRLTGVSMRQRRRSYVDAGANVLVAGSAIFGDREGVAAAMKRLRAARGTSEEWQVTMTRNKFERFEYQSRLRFRMISTGLSAKDKFLCGLIDG